MLKEKQPLIEELTWQDVRDSVISSCKDLADIIDDISPSKEHTVFKIRYPFGMKIADKTSFYLPTDLNTPILATDPEIANNIKSKLAYNSLPLGIIVKNTAEIFFDIHRKVFSQLANSEEFSTKWYCEVVFLSAKWTESIKKDADWSKLAFYISQKGWQHSEYDPKKST